MNTGEIDELKAALSLIYWRDNQQNGINSVKSHDNFEYLSHNLSLSDIATLNKAQLVNICSECNITKAPSSIKADIKINNVGISLKSNRSALPALINHTHRVGIEQVCQRIGLDIAPLDEAIDNYWNLRLSGKINEDVKMSTANNPFEPIKDYLVHLLAYFLFSGTARGNSDVQADGLISFTNPTNYTTWTRYSKEDAARQYIDKITISIRSKAMPDSYNHTATSARDKSIKIWTRWADGSYKGTLHIRG